VKNKRRGAAGGMPCGRQCSLVTDVILLVTRLAAVRKSWRAMMEAQLLTEMYCGSETAGAAQGSDKLFDN